MDVNALLAPLTTPIAVRWAGNIPGSAAMGGAMWGHHYMALGVQPRNIWPGERIRLYVPPPSWPVAIGGPATWGGYDPAVEGTIRATIVEGDGWKTVELRNDITVNPIKRVWVSLRVPRGGSDNETSNNDDRTRDSDEETNGSTAWNSDVDDVVRNFVGADDAAPDDDEDGTDVDIPSNEESATSADEDEADEVERMV